jgi:3-hydroxyisobutyrate dehydrogenase-like beta-hydroxyacid dehydrogenase
MRIAFIGLGHMGLPIASNLLNAGYSLVVWNRTREKAAPLVAKGATQADTPRDAVDPSGIVITMVADDAAVEGVVFGPDGFGEKLGQGGLHIAMSTISPTLSKRLAEYHQARGAAYVAAPVFGRPDAAAAKKLFVLCAGPVDARQRARPLLEAVGQKVFDITEEPSHANVIKLGGNFMIMAAIEAMAEAFTLGEKHGVPREKFMEVLTQSLFSAPAYVNYGKQIANHAYEPPGFKLSLGFKDANLVAASANNVLAPMPLGALMVTRFQAAMAKGWQDLDWAGVALNVTQDAGLDVKKR